MSPLLALLPLWLTAKSLPGLAVGEAAARPFVVVPAALADDPKVADLRSAGARLILSFGLNSFGPDVKTRPTSWFAQNLWGVEKPQRGGETLTLADDDALAYQIARAQAFAARERDWAGVVVTVDLRTDQGSFRYDESERARAVAATGLDPIDFDDPFEWRNDGVDGTPLPPKLLDFLAADGRARARRVALALAAPFAKAGKLVALRIDPALVGASPARHLVAYGDWTTMLDLPGLSALWFAASKDRDPVVQAGSLAAELQRLRAPRLRLGVFGAAKDLPAAPDLDAIEVGA